MHIMYLLFYKKYFTYARSALRSRRRVISQSIRTQALDRKQAFAARLGSRTDTKSDPGQQVQQTAQQQTLNNDQRGSRVENLPVISGRDWVVIMPREMRS